VLATHTPLSGKSSFLSATVLQSKIALYNTYALGARLAQGRVPHGLYWDTADPYHYLRVEPQHGFDYAIFGGEDHKTGQVTDTTACYRALEQTLQRILPGAEVTERWSGQVIETNDGLPYIGETADRQFVATGFAGNGMTFGTIAAMMARDTVLGRQNPWRELFDPRRTKVRGGAWDYIRENKDYAYYMVRDRLVARHAQSLRGLGPEDGEVIKIDGRPIAAYRDSRGVVMLRSALCTHMGCEVHWNRAEATWDCPCHGSRFRPDGTVISGPAESPLADPEAP
jgi:Rieske Fe-S protein